MEEITLYANESRTVTHHGAGNMQSSIIRSRRGGARMSKCRSCGTEIQFIKSAKTGKPLPVEMKKQTIVTDDGRTVTGYTSHFATCPQANYFRKG